MACAVLIEEGAFAALLGLGLVAVLLSLELGAGVAAGEAGGGAGESAGDGRAMGEAGGGRDDAVLLLPPAVELLSDCRSARPEQQNPDNVTLPTGVQQHERSNTPVDTWRAA